MPNRDRYRKSKGGVSGFEEEESKRQTPAQVLSLVLPLKCIYGKNKNAILSHIDCCSFWVSKDLTQGHVF